MEVWGRSAAVNRLTVLAAVLLLWAGVIMARLVSLQVAQHDKYAALARSQQEHKIDMPAPRGSIYDRNGQPLALSVSADSVSVNPMQIADLRVATEMLGNLLHLDQQVLYSRLQWARDNHRGFLWIRRRLNAFETDRLKAVHLDYVQFHPDSVRRYPSNKTASHIIGAVYKGEEGAAGVERSFDQSLRGHAGSERLVMDVKRRGIEAHVDAQPQSVT